jgi:hypothetical protein
MKIATFVLALAILPIVARAHHSLAEYDRTSIFEIEGELVAVRWRNPHVMFTVRVAGLNGQLQDWELESSAVYVVERSGVQESLFAGGGHVKAAGWRSPDRSAMRVTNLLLPSGEEILLTGVVGNRWSDDYSGGRLAGERVDRADLDLYRVWSIEDLGKYSQSVQQSEVQLTATGQQKMAAEFTLDLCSPQGMPSIMQNPLPIEFINNGDTINIRLVSFGVVRTIHMGGASSVELMPLSDLGYSVGRRTGDTLEVRTTRVGWPYYDDLGTPQTNNVEIMERFSLLDGKSRLSYRQTVSDPASFLEPLTTSWDWVDIGEDQVEVTECE